jgi:hypothetical protein
MVTDGATVRLFSVITLIERRQAAGLTGEALETAVLKEIRRREKEGQIADWPVISYYDSEAAYEATLDSDGHRKHRNRADRHLISVIASGLRKQEPAGELPSDEASCNTSDELESKYESPDFVDNSRYRPWENAPGMEWMELPTLFKFACKIIHRHYGRYIHFDDFNDLLQEAWIAVNTKAVPNFDPSSDAVFTSFAYRVIENHIIDVVRRESRAREHLDHGIDMALLGPGQVTL